VCLPLRFNRKFFYESQQWTLQQVSYPLLMVYLYC